MRFTQEILEIQDHIYKKYVIRVMAVYLGQNTDNKSVKISVAFISVISPCDEDTNSTKRYFISEN